MTSKLTEHKMACVGWLLAYLLLAGIPGVMANDLTGWLDHGGDRGGSRYSALGQINRDNVDSLQRVWTFRSGAGQSDAATVGLQATPILLPEVAGGFLVICTPFNIVIALDPLSGGERWRFDPKVERGGPVADYQCRGVSQWHDDSADADEECAWRIFLATSDRRLYALDARTGKSCSGFGDLGLVRLSPLIKAATPAVATATVRTFMPPAIVRDTVVVGTSIGSKYRRTDAPSGAVRAFDARSGKFRWFFDPLPHGTSGAASDDWEEQALAATGGANVGSLMSVDEERDLVFLPTSGASPEFFGGTRKGNNLYANSTIALRGSTGELVWYFQTVHHDVWGSDAGSQPVLVEISRGQQQIPVVVQLTTHGFTFVLNRDTGEPLFPVEERAVAQAGVAGESLSPTQPFPTAPPPLSATTFGPDEAWGFTFYDQGVCRKILAPYRSGGPFVPPSGEGTVVVPGTVSGWGSGAFDAGRNLFITNAQNVPLFLRLLPRDEVDREQAKSPLAGLPDGPPGIIQGTPYALERGSKRLLSPLGLPCTKPPWNSLVAIDLEQGKIAWSVPLGSLEKTAGLPLEFGAPGAGGPIVTAGGIVFIGATADEKFRAFDIENGEKLWEVGLPTAGMATPMTYAAGGRQFVVIAAGGDPDYYPGKVGDYLVAFALPD